MPDAKEYTIEQIADHILARGAIHPQKLMLLAWYVYSCSLLPEFQDHGIRITDSTFTASGHGPRHAGLAKRCLANDNILIAQNTAELKPDPELDSFLDMILYVYDRYTVKDLEYLVCHELPWTRAHHGVSRHLDSPVVIKPEWILEFHKEVQRQIRELEMKERRTNA